jgi:hypothetical protein
MQRLAVIARLKEGTTERAAELIAEGPPFDPRAAGFERHSVFLAADQIVFVFEGGSLAPLVRMLREADDTGALGAWSEVIEGIPHVAREVYAWVRPAETFAAGWGE